MNNFIFDKNRFETLLNEIKDTVESLPSEDLQSVMVDMFHCIDHTTLRDEDNDKYVADFCHTAAGYCTDPQLGSMASVCVYPEYASVAKREVAAVGMKVAAVVGGFPTGQMPLLLKLQEIRYAIDNGADEVDFVINRGHFLGGNKRHLAEEITAARHECGEAILLKVILETGQLKEPALIYAASMTAIENGADFVKTSTGKSGIGATPEAAYSMLCAIKDFHKKTSRRVGFKVSGGVSTTADALLYYFMTKKILGIVEINNQIFRIGTSRLVGDLSKKLTF